MATAGCKGCCVVIGEVWVVREVGLYRRKKRILKILDEYLSILDPTPFLGDF